MILEGHQKYISQGTFSIKTFWLIRGNSFVKATVVNQNQTSICLFNANSTLHYVSLKTLCTKWGMYVYCDQHFQAL